MRTDFFQAKERELYHDEHVKAYTILNGDRFYDPISSANSVIMSAHEITLQPQTSLPSYEVRYNKIIVYVQEGEVSYTNNSGAEPMAIKENNVFSTASPLVLENVFHNHSKTKVARLFIVLYATGLSSYVFPHSIPAEKTNFPCRDLLFSERKTISSTRKKVALPADMYRLTGNQTYAVNPHHTIWLYILNGSVTLDNRTMEKGDSLALYQETDLHLTNAKDMEVVLIDIQQPHL